MKVSKNGAQSFSVQRLRLVVIRKLLISDLKLREHRQHIRPLLHFHELFPLRRSRARKGTGMVSVGKMNLAERENPAPDRPFLADL